MKILIGVNMSISRKKRSRFLIGVAFSCLLLGTAPLGNAQTQNSGVPLTLQEAIKNLEMENGSKDFKFKSANITEKKAVFTDVTFAEKDSVLKSKTVTLFRRPVDGKFALIMENASSLGGNADLTAGEISVVFDEIMEGDKRKLIIKKADGEEGFQADLKISDAALFIKDDKQRISIKSIFVDNFSSVNKMRFDDLKVADIGFTTSGVKFNVAKFEIGGLSDYLFDKFNETAESKIEGSEDKTNNIGLVGTGLEVFQKASIGKFLIEGVNVAPLPSKTKKNAKAKNAFDFFKIAKIEVRNFDNKKLDKLSIEGVDFRAVSDNSPLIIKLGQFSFDDFRFDLFKTFTSAYFAAGNEEASKKIRDTKLSDIMKKGPLDLTLRAFNFSGFQVNADGVSMTLDRMAFTAGKEVNGVYTELDMPDGTMEFKLSNAKNSMAKAATSGLSEFGLEDFKMTFGSHATYDPQTDILNTDKSYFRIDKFLDFKTESKAGNVMGWLKTVSIGDILDLAMPPKESDKAAQAALSAAIEAAQAANNEAGKDETLRSANRAETFRNPEILGAVDEETPSPLDELSPEQLKAQFEKYKLIYKGLKLLSVNFELNDLGMLDLIASDEGIESGKSARKIREEWAKDWELKADEEKDTPAFLREAFAVIANFVKKGGAIRVQLENEKGVEFGDFMSLEADHKALGFKVSN